MIDLFLTRPLGQPLSLHRQSEISANEIRRKLTTKQKYYNYGEN